MRLLDGGAGGSVGNLEKMGFPHAAQNVYHCCWLALLAGQVLKLVSLHQPKSNHRLKIRNSAWNFPICRIFRCCMFILEVWTVNWDATAMQCQGMDWDAGVWSVAQQCRMGQLCHGLAGLATVQLAAVVNIHLWPAFAVFPFIQRSGVHALTQPSSVLISPLSRGAWRRKPRKTPSSPFSRLLQVFYLPFSSPGAFFSFSLSLQSCQYQVPPWLSLLPLVILRLFLAPAAQRLPRHVSQQACMYCIHFIHSHVMAV